MKKNRSLISFIVLVLCFGLCGSLLGELESAPRKKRSRAASSRKGQRAKSRTAKRGRKRVSSRRSRRGSRAVPRSSASRTSYYDLPIEDRNLLSAINDAEQAGAKIEEHELRSHIKFLSDDLLEGRGTGARGGLLAAKYIAAKFESLGLEPAAADRTYFQQVGLVGIKADQSTKLTVKGAGESAEFAYGEQFVAGADIEKPEIPINADVIFLGYGVQSPENNWDDYKGLDVRGKVLLMMVNDPPATQAEPNLFGGKALTYYGRWTYKYEEAARRGALGVILIHTNESAGYGWQVVRSSWGGERFGLVPTPGTPALSLKAWMTEDAARKLASIGGQNLDQLRQAAQSRAFRPVPLNAKVETTLKTTVRRVQAPNVVAILRGSDDALRGEYVVFSAHWDHLGVRPDQAGDNIYNGAVDNATGIAGMLAIAKACQSLNTKPKRSILFIATTAEEQGLLGAEHYARYPVVPLAKTVANINLDSMNVLGQTTDITPLGADRSTLGKFIEAVAGENQLTISPDARPEQGSFYRSDHFPFAKAGIPAVSFNPGTNFVGHSAEWGREKFKDYNENRYHQPSDEYSPHWDFNGLVQQAKLAFWVGLRVANADETPQWNKGDEFERARLESLTQSQSQNRPQ
jgi:Zn-dependent M28 family amino/carboxypeptidase